VIDIRNQCIAAGVAFFFKQWGGRSPKSGGRLLEGKEWNQFPVMHTAAAAPLQTRVSA
jgi:protein gp37